MQLPADRIREIFQAPKSGDIWAFLRGLSQKSPTKSPSNTSRAENQRPFYSRWEYFRACRPQSFSGAVFCAFQRLPASGSPFTAEGVGTPVLSRSISSRCDPLRRPLQSLVIFLSPPPFSLIPLRTTCQQLLTLILTAVEMHFNNC